MSAIAVFTQKDLNLLPSGIRDSKKVSQKMRESLFDPILDTASDVGIGAVWPEEINRLTPEKALRLSYDRAVNDLRFGIPDMLIVDGQRLLTGYRGKQRCEPKADLNHVQVSAASIVAKVFRDQVMREMHRRHPAYGWAGNSGYGTKEHEEAIRRYGLTVEHRRDWTKKFR